MGNYSDPTASAALGKINREFSRIEKKAKTLRRLFDEGKISAEDLEKAQSQFRGIYKHVLNNVLAEDSEQQNRPRCFLGGDFNQQQKGVFEKTLFRRKGFDRSLFR